MTLNSSTFPYCGPEPYNENCGTYYEYNGSQVSVTQVAQTGLLDYSTLTLPVDGSSNLETTGQYDVSPCSTSLFRPASKLLRSYKGPQSDQYKGLAIQATFYINTADITSFTGTLEQGVFLHENQCYDGHREYGIILNNLDGYVYFYWCTNCTNTSAPYAVVNHYVPGAHYSTYTGNTFSDGPLWFIMYPEDDGGGNCHFVTRIEGAAPNYGVYDATSSHDVNIDHPYPSGSDYSNSITSSVDTGFCSAIEGETDAYVSAEIKDEPTVAMSRADRNYITINYIDVGK
jgi:hypothetical protein